MTVYITSFSSVQAKANLLTHQQHGATLYTLQLGLNLIWMPLFFGLQRPIEATADIVTLVGVTGYLTYVWSKVDTVASWLMVPYLGWLGFATYLTVSFFFPSNVSRPGKRWQGSSANLLCRLDAVFSMTGISLTRRRRRKRSRLA